MNEVKAGINIPCLSSEAVHCAPSGAYSVTCDLFFTMIAHLRRANIYSVRVDEPDAGASRHGMFDRQGNVELPPF